MPHRTVLFAIAIGLLGICALGGAWVGAGWVWDTANGVGFMAVALLCFLHIETGAARGRPASQAAFHARLHANIAVLALGLVALHVAALLADDPVTIEYWKLSAPPYMLAGLAALMLLGAIVATAYPKPRRALFSNPLRFRRTHGIASLLLMGLAAWHIAGSALYLDTQFKQLVFVTVLVGVPLWLILRRPALTRPSASSAAPGVARRAPAEARTEAIRIGAAALTLAVVFAVLRDVL